MARSAARRFVGAGLLRRPGTRWQAGGGASLDLLDLVSGGTFTRATVGWYQTSASTIAEAAIGARRFADIGGSEGAKLLIEQQHTNVVPNSRDITAGTYSAALSTTTTGNVEAGPDGAVLADRSQVSSAGYSRWRTGITAGVGCASLWAKRLTGAGPGTLQTQIGAAGGFTGRVAALTEAWQPIQIRSVYSGGGNLFIPADGRTVATAYGDPLTAQAMDVLTDFLQWEVGATYARSPIVTAGSSATCDPDDLSWSSGTWDTRLTTDAWTMDVWPLYGSGALSSGVVRWLMTFGSSSDGIRIRHDGTACRVEMVDGGSVVAASGYETWDAHDLLRIVIDVPNGIVKVNGVQGPPGTAPTWPTAVTLRLGGIAGAAVGSGVEADARFDAPKLGEIDSPFIASVLYLGDSITVGGNSLNSNGYKSRISALAAMAGKNYQNVGPYRNGSDLDINHAGVSGNIISQMTARLATDVTPYAPRVVGVHAGTNDLPTGVPGMQTDLTALLSAIRAALPSAFILIFEIPERTLYTTQVADYNTNAIPAAVAAAGLVSGTYTIVSPGVVLADLVDGVHPGNGGHDKIAAAGWAGISAWLTSIGE